MVAKQRQSDKEEAMEKLKGRAKARELAPPGKAKLISRYFYQSAGCPSLFRVKSALERTKVAILTSVLVALLVHFLQDEWVAALDKSKAQRDVASSSASADGALTASGFQQSVSDWQLLDGVTTTVVVMAAAFLAHFYFFQLATMKQGKMNCHLAVQIEADSNARLFARHIKARADVIAHSVKKLEAAAGSITLGLVTVISGLMLRHTLAVAYCNDWDGLEDDDVRPWRNQAGLVIVGGDVIALYALTMASSAMWNILVEQSRQEVQAEEPAWFEIFLPYAHDIRHVRSKVDRGHPNLLLHLLPLAFHIMRMCCAEAVGWMLAQVLDWCFTIVQLLRSVFSCCRSCAHVPSCCCRHQSLSCGHCWGACGDYDEFDREEDDQGKAEDEKNSRQAAKRVEDAVMEQEIQLKRENDLKVFEKEQEDAAKRDREDRERQQLVAMRLAFDSLLAEKRRRAKSASTSTSGRNSDSDLREPSDSSDEEGQVRRPFLHQTREMK